MANRTKGEVVFTAGEDDEAEDYTLVLDFNALCDLEEDFPGIMQGQLNLDTFRNIRTMIRHALAAHHAGLSDREVGAIIQDVGMAKAAEAVGEAMRASFPAEAGETENPQKNPA